MKQIHVVEFEPTDTEQGGVGGMNWSIYKDEIERKYLKFITEDAGYTVRRWSIEVPADLKPEDTTDYVEGLINAGAMPAPKQEHQSMDPRDALDDLAKLAILGIQFKDETLWYQYFRAIGREDDPVVEEINKRRIKLATDMDEIRAKFGI